MPRSDLMHLATLANSLGCNQVELCEELLTRTAQFYIPFPTDLDLLITEGRKRAPRDIVSKLQDGSKSIPPHLVREKPDFIKISPKDVSIFLRHKFHSVDSCEAICFSGPGDDLEDLEPWDYCLKFSKETEGRSGVSERFKIVRVDGIYKTQRYGGSCEPSNIEISINDIFAPESLMVSISHILQCGDSALKNVGITPPVWMSKTLWVMNKVWYGVVYEKPGSQSVSRVSSKEKKRNAADVIEFYMQKELSNYLVKVILQIVFSNPPTVSRLTNLAREFSYEFHPEQPEFLKVINGLAEKFWDEGIKGIAGIEHWEAARMDVSQKYGIGKRVAEHLDDIIVFGK